MLQVFLLAIDYAYDSTSGDRTLKKPYLEGTKHGTQPAVNRTTSGLRTGFRPNHGQAKVTQGLPPSQTPSTPDPLTASSGLTYRGSPITPMPYTSSGFPTSDENGSFESSADTLTAPTTKSTGGQTVLKTVNPRAMVRVTLMSSFPCD